ncbi:hypothetical protein GURASL_24050 [Geotalea uraniireducens]|uniref:Uncharacterized protein n=1 Tax=Geotalea uraniireducens TaxID=351604 RepID=A0ABM8EM23_9BACT|nr:hypothetical protein GURASL_24050 [Geotalea uraniireducens]
MFMALGSGNLLLKRFEIVPGLGKCRSEPLDFHRHLLRGDGTLHYRNTTPISQPDRADGNAG